MKKIKAECQQKDILENRCQKFTKIILLAIAAILSSFSLVYGNQYMQWLRVKITGTNRPNILDGTPEKDLIRGRGGGDTIDGRSDNDRIFGGRGSDDILGEGGDDTLAGGPGADHFKCGSGSDTITYFSRGATRTANC